MCVCVCRACACVHNFMFLNLKLTVVFHTDGQKIAKKLYSQINRETSSIKCLLSEYHTCLSVTKPSSSEVITLSEALDSSTIGQKLRSQCCTVASGKDRQIIDAYLLFCRSTEEVTMIREESSCVVSYYEKKRQAIRRLIEELSQSDSVPYIRGAIAMLHQLLTVVTGQLELSHRTAKIVNSEHCKTPDDDDLQPWSDIDCSSCSSDSDLESDD